MDKSKQNLKGSDRRDEFKLRHKSLSPSFYASDLDLCLISNKPPGIIAFEDYKRLGEPITFAEIIQYNTLLLQAPIYIIGGDDPAGPFVIERYMVGDWKLKTVNLEYVTFVKDWYEFGKWEWKIRIEYFNQWIEKEKANMETQTLTKTEMQISNPTALAVRERRELTPALWHMISEVAPVMHLSRLFGAASKEAAAAIILKGYELGLGITASFEFIQVIQGKPSLSPRGALAILHGHPEIKELKITRLSDDKGFIGFECYMKRVNGFSYTVQFKLEDAKRAGLVKPNSGWANYPENMCLWRAVGFCADVVAPDITAGMTALMKAPENYDVEISGEGDVITAEAKDVQPAPPAPYPPGFTLDQLTAQYSVDDILSANDGRIPGTDEEVAAVAAKLSVR